MGSELTKVYNSPYPWQSEVLKELEQESDSRTVRWIFDSVGNTGKSHFQKSLVFRKNAVLIPVDNAREMMRIRSTVRPQANIVLLNFTRTIADTKMLDQIYSGIESIKDGLYVSTKYVGSFVVQEHPHVFVFANFLPRLESVSMDRYKFSRIVKKTLILEKI